MAPSLPGRRPTLADVARAAGVSLSTVDRLLNGRTAVRGSTAERVQQAAQALGYHASGVIGQRTLTQRRRRRFGFLLRPESDFYRALATELEAATAAAPGVRGSAQVAFLQDMTPDAVHERMLALGRQVDALAVVAPDHARISAATEQLQAEGVPVFALISDLSAPQRAGCIAPDHRRIGRTAAWFITQLAQAPGEIGVFVGSHRFQCQELCEMSFRSYVREHAPGFTVLEPVVTLESDQAAEEGLRSLLQRHPDLTGFYVDGGGIRGVLQAVADLRRQTPALRLVGVGHDLTPVTRAGLLAGHLSAVLSMPRAAMAQALLQAMNAVLDDPTLPPQQVVLPIEISTPESV